MGLKVPFIRLLQHAICRTVGRSRACTVASFNFKDWIIATDVECHSNQPDHWPKVRNCLVATLGIWYWSLGSISVTTVDTPKVEAFYWVAITFSQTLGTALGDWMADSTGYEHGAFIFGAGLALLAAAYFWTSVSRVFLFWAAFILSRPLGATVGDFLDKPVANGGLNLSRPIASAVIGVFIIVCLFVLPQRAGQHPGRSETVA
jgi:uncharacterized membrane-anchored protein